MSIGRCIACRVGNIERIASRALGRFLNAWLVREIACAVSPTSGDSTASVTRLIGVVFTCWKWKEVGAVI